MVNVTDSQYRPMQYILAKDNVKFLYNLAIPLSFFHFVQRSDTSHGVYLRAAFMIEFAQHPTAIIRGWLL